MGLGCLCSAMYTTLARWKTAPALAMPRLAEPRRAGPGPTTPHLARPRLISPSRAACCVVAILLHIWVAPAAAQQDVIATDFLYSTTKVTIGGSSFDQVLRVVGLPSISGGASAAIGVDANGNIRQDSGTSISTGGAWTWAGIGTFSAGLASPVKVSGGTSLSLAALVSDNVRLGTNSGTPRLILEDSGATYQIQQDNNAGQWRLARLISDGSCPAPGCTPITVDDLIKIDPKGKHILPALADDINIGSFLLPFLTLHVSELWAATLVAQDTIATYGGSAIFAPTSYLLTSVTSTGTTFALKHNDFASGDRGVLKADGRVEYVAFTSGPTAINKCSSHCDADVTTSWTGAGGTLSADHNIRFQGDSSVLWTQTTGSTRSIYHQATGDTAASTQYTMSLYLRRSDGAAIVPTVTDYLIICGDGSVLPQPTATDAGGGWYRLSAVCTTSGSETDVIGVTGLVTGFNYNLDAAQIETGSTLTPWSLTSSSYTVTRDLDGSGGNAWDANTAIVNLGQTGNGFMECYSTRGLKASTEIGPTCVANLRLSNTYNDWAPRAAWGQLNGVYGYASSTFGFAAGDSTATWMSMDATNGFRVMSGATQKFRAYADGHLSIVEGAITIDDLGVRIQNTSSSSAEAKAYTFYGSGTPSHAKRPGLFYSEGSGTSTLDLLIDNGGINVQGDTTVNFWSGTRGFTATASATTISSNGTTTISSYTGSTTKVSGEAQLLLQDTGLTSPADYIALTNSGGVHKIDFVSDQNIFAFATIPSSTTTSSMYPVTWSSADNRIWTRRDVLTTTVVVPCGTLTFSVGLLTNKGACP